MDGAESYGAELLGGRYRLVERLGAGGMSVVWRGFDEVLGRQVAVKVLASRLANDRAFRHQLRVEAKAAARLIHPHITNVYDYGEAVEDGMTVPYVVMELVDGEPLAVRLARNRLLPWREAVVVAAEVASALTTAHARGVVHRDVTPGNVMLTSSGVKVVDFGISALTGENEDGPEGQLLGTPAYLAPERLVGGQVSPATDVYAVGLLLYRTLTGRLPWQASTTTQMLQAHLYQDPTPMPPVEGLPDEVAEICARCLAKTPAQRPSSAEVARTLAIAAGIMAVLPVSPAPAGVGGPAELATAGTTILPWSAATDALPLSHPPAGRRPSGQAFAGPRTAGRRRAEAAGVGVLLLAATGLLWAAASANPGGRGGTPVRAEAGVTSAAACQVGYALRTDTGRGFDAELTVQNISGQPLRDWALAFVFPADQTITGIESARWQQQGRDVVLRPAVGATDLAPGASAVIGLTGTYTAANPLPVQFRLGESACGVQVSGIAGSSGTSTPGAITQAPPITARGDGSSGPGVQQPTAPSAGSAIGTGKVSPQRPEQQKPDKPKKQDKNGDGDDG
jgi:hypothetical protein